MRVVFSDESGVGSKKTRPDYGRDRSFLDMDRPWEPVSRTLYAIRSQAREGHKGFFENGRTLKGKLLYSAVRRGVGGGDAGLRAVLQLPSADGAVALFSAVDPQRV